MRITDLTPQQIGEPELCLEVLPNPHRRSMIAVNGWGSFKTLAPREIVDIVGLFIPCDGLLPCRYALE